MKKKQFLSIFILMFLTVFSYGAEPELTMDKLSQSLKSRNWEDVYYCFSKETTLKLELFLKKTYRTIEDAVKKNPNLENDSRIKEMLSLLSLSGKDFFIMFFGANPVDIVQKMTRFSNYKIVKKEIFEKKAKITITNDFGIDIVYLILEENIWRIDLTRKLAQLDELNKKTN